MNNPRENRTARRHYETAVRLQNRVLELVRECDELREALRYYAKAPYIDNGPARAALKDSP